MIDRLRELLDRPIADRMRRRLFAVVAAVVLVVALALALTGRSSQRIPAPPTASPTSRSRPPVRPSRTARPAGPAEPGTRAAEAAARRFLVGYLPYLYGHGAASAIRGASPKLRRRLGGERPRVSPATRRRRGRVAELSARRLADWGFAVTATIDDGGVARYPITLMLERRGGGLETTEVGGE